MSEHDSLLRAVIDNPEDNAPRLVYADWLDEHGEPDHAELIRLQCALARRGGVPKARRVAVKQRVAEILVQPSFAHPTYETETLLWERGFIAQYPLEIRGERGRGFDGCSLQGRTGFSRLGPWILGIKLRLSSWVRHPAAVWRRHVDRAWPRPITELVFYPLPSATVMRSIASAPCLDSVRSLGCYGGVPVEGFSDVVLSPRLAKLEVVHVDGAFQAETRRGETSESDDPRVVAAWQRILFSPRTRNFRALILSARGIGPAIASAVADSPHLGNLQDLYLLGSDEYPESLRRRLHTRFGRVWWDVRFGRGHDIGPVDAILAGSRRRHRHDR